MHAPLLQNLCDQSETGPLVVFHATLPGLLFAPGKIECRIVIILHLTSACLRVLLAHPHTDTPPHRPPSGLSMGAWEWRPALGRAAQAVHLVRRRIFRARREAPASAAQVMESL